MKNVKLQRTNVDDFGSSLRKTQLDGYFNKIKKTTSNSTRHIFALFGNYLLVSGSQVRGGILDKISIPEGLGVVTPAPHEDIMKIRGIQQDPTKSDSYHFKTKQGTNVRILKCEGSSHTGDRPSVTAGFKR